MKTSALFLITVFAFSNIAYSQGNPTGLYGKSLAEKFYVKAGIDLSSVSNGKLQVNKIDFFTGISDTGFMISLRLISEITRIIIIMINLMIIFRIILI